MLGFCLLVMLVSYPAMAQQDNSTHINSLLWRISGNGLSKPSYLFGTIHMICPDDYFLTGKMKETLANSDKVCFEFNLSDTSLTRKMKAGLIDKSGKRLNDYYSPDEYAMVLRYFKDSLNVDIDKLQQLKPVVLQSLIFKKIVGCPNPASYEKTILKVAQNQGKEVMGLETIEEQMALLETLSSKIVKASVLLAKGSRKIYEMHDAWQKLVNTYQQQDIALLYRSASGPNSVYFNEAFLDERNKKWIPYMQDKMQGASVFFAVGAAHLWGDQGVISLLKKAGYTVEPMIDTVNIHKIPPGDVLTNADHMPKPRFDLKQYFSENIHYPKEAMKQHIEGRVLVKFVVNEDGTISDCTITKGIGSGCDEEAIRVVKNMGAWDPGMKDGKPVKVYFTLPISFKLD